MERFSNLSKLKTFAQFVHFSNSVDVVKTKPRSPIRMRRVENDISVYNNLVPSSKPPIKPLFYQAVGSATSDSEQTDHSSVIPLIHRISVLEQQVNSLGNIQPVTARTDHVTEEFKKQLEHHQTVFTRNLHQIQQRFLKLEEQLKTIQQMTPKLRAIMERRDSTFKRNFSRDFNQHSEEHKQNIRQALDAVKHALQWQKTHKQCVEEELARYRVDLDRVLDFQMSPLPLPVTPPVTKDWGLSKELDRVQKVLSESCYHNKAKLDRVQWVFYVSMVCMWMYVFFTNNTTASTTENPYMFV